MRPPDPRLCRIRRLKRAFAIRRFRLAGVQFALIGIVSSANSFAVLFHPGGRILTSFPRPFNPVSLDSSTCQNCVKNRHRATQDPQARTAKVAHCRAAAHIRCFHLQSGRSQLSLSRPTFHPDIISKSGVQSTDNSTTA